MLGQFPVFCADVGDQNGGHMIQLAQSAHSGTFGQKLLGGIGELALIAIVECFVRRIPRIVAAHLELFLIAEMLVHIIVEKFGAGYKPYTRLYRHEPQKNKGLLQKNRQKFEKEIRHY